MAKKSNKLTTLERYEDLCYKYPHINAVEGEDLSIPRATTEIIRKCWFDVVSFEQTEDIANATGLCQRQIFRIAKLNKFPKRRNIKMVNYGELVRLPVSLQSSHKAVECDPKG
jgi:hypothetical protein